MVGLAGGIVRDLLIFTPPATFRDWRYLAVAGAAGIVTSIAHPAIDRLRRPIEVLDPLPGYAATPPTSGGDTILLALTHRINAAAPAVAA